MKALLGYGFIIKKFELKFKNKGDYILRIDFRFFLEILNQSMCPLIL